MSVEQVRHDDSYEKHERSHGHGTKRVMSCVRTASPKMTRPASTQKYAGSVKSDLVDLLRAMRGEVEVVDIAKLYFDAC